MKQGQTVSELRTELQRQAESERDFLVAGNMLRMETDNGAPRFKLPVSEELLPATSFAHGQVADYLEIPRAYYRRMEATEPELLADNVNAWLGNLEDEKRRMVRTIHSGVRAFVSDKFRRDLSNFGIARKAFDIIIGEQGGEPVSQCLTEKKLYLKFVYRSLEFEIPGRVGDIVQAGIIMGNSEVGAGKYFVSPYATRLSCLNGMVAEMSISKYHVGRRIEVAEKVEALLSDSTRDLQDAALWAEVEDIMRASFDKDVFGAWVDSMGEAADRKIKTGHLPAVVELTRRELRLPASTEKSILDNLAEGGDLTQWGLANAITATANDLDNYETATELEAAGGKLIELDAAQWERIATAEPKKVRAAA